MLSLIQNPEPSHTLGAMLYMENAKIHLYEKILNKVEGDSTPSFITAFHVAIESSCITFTYRIAAVAEALFKCFENLYQAALNKDKEQVLRGLKQLYLDFPTKCIELFAITFEIPLGAGVTVVSMMLDPRKYCKERANYHHNQWQQFHVLRTFTFPEETQLNPVAENCVKDPTTYVEHSQEGNGEPLTDENPRYLPSPILHPSTPHSAPGTPQKSVSAKYQAWVNTSAPTNYSY